MADSKPIQVDPETHALVRQVCDAQRRTASVVIKRALREFIKNHPDEMVPDDETWAAGA